MLNFDAKFCFIVRTVVQGLHQDPPLAKQYILRRPYFKISPLRNFAAIGAVAWKVAQSPYFKQPFFKCLWKFNLHENLIYMFYIGAVTPE